jgi:hypothetical protein
MENTKRWLPGVMAAIAALIGLYLVFIAPGYFDATMDKLIIVKTKQATVFASGPLTRLFIGSFYSGIEMLAGLGLIVTSFALYKGKKWAWSMAVLLLAIPAIGNFYIGLGWLENLKAFPPAYITFILSLVAFWAMILLKENEGKTKVVLFVIFTLLGMVGAQAFTFFPHALRVVMKDYGAALLDPSVSILRHTGPLPRPFPPPISISCPGGHTKGFNLHICLLDGWSTGGRPCHLAANPLLQKPLIY